MKMENIAKNYWDSSPEDELVRINSHWKSHGRITDEHWKEIGEADKTRLIKYVGGDFPNQTFLEWGCGGGAKMAAIAPLFSRSYGIDISKPNINECRKQLKALEIKATLIQVDIDNPGEAVKHLKNKIDVLFCVAVIDHMPSKQYVSSILTVWNQILKPTGMAMVEYRLKDDERFFHKTGDYNKDVAFWTTFEHHEFKNMAVNAGFFDVEPVEYLEHCGYQYAVLKKELSCKNQF